MGRKIGILGGTFNPIHNGHLALAECALEQLSLDEIWFMPSNQTNLKKGLYILPGEARKVLIELAICDKERFRLSDMELKREGITYTFETLCELRSLYPEDAFYFILGADCLFSIEKWMQPMQIMSNATLVSAIRGDADKDALNMQANYLRQTYLAQIILLDFPKEDISSSEIRSMISQNKSISDYVPDNVAEYIQKHSYYKGK